MGINISEAWKFSTGTKKVRVGVMDTGIAIHEDLNSNLVRGYDYVNKNSIMYDDEGSHGPGVCVIIGTYRLNPRVRIYINLSITD